MILFKNNVLKYTTNNVLYTYFLQQSEEPILRKMKYVIILVILMFDVKKTIKTKQLEMEIHIVLCLLLDMGILQARLQV